MASEVVFRDIVASNSEEEREERIRRLIRVLQKDSLPGISTRYHMVESIFEFNP